MKTTTTLLLTILFATCVARSATTADSVEAIDAWFSALGKSKQSIPQATLQTWVHAQRNLATLERIAADPATERPTAWRARYVAAYGFSRLELFDIAHAVDVMALDAARDSSQRELTLRDLSQALEDAGQFEASAKVSEQLMASLETPGNLELNNHALRLLKAGRFDESVAYVERISLDAETGHTRIFSARALAYLGRYDAAAAELRKACDIGESAACRMIERLESETSPEAYWKGDREFRQRAWQPYNLIDTAIALTRLLSSLGDHTRISGFAPSYWFNEIHDAYPALDAGEEIRPRRPVTLPNGRIGTVILGGVPFFAASIDRGVDADSVDRAVAAYLAGVHGPSAWDKTEETIRTRALVAPLPAPGGGTHLAIIVHTDWQEQLVRNALDKRPWRLVEPLR